MVKIEIVKYFAEPPEAWNFYIGGYQPAPKWLKSCKGRTLGNDDVAHYQRIVRVLWETGGDVMRECLRNFFIYNEKTCIFAPKLKSE